MTHTPLTTRPLLLFMNAALAAGLLCFAPGCSQTPPGSDSADDLAPGPGPGPDGGAPADLAGAAPDLGGTGTTPDFAATGGGDMSDPFGGPSVCTSGMSWTSGDRGSPGMHPGRACVTCHSMGRGPLFSIAGTVYPTAHEPDDCLSTAGPVVVVTDSGGNSVSLQTNSHGNFYSVAALTPPYHVKVTYMGRERAMRTPQMSGDCNSCHTQTGMNGAPGRVLTP